MAADPTGVAADVAGVNPAQAKANAIADVEEHTPDVPEHKEPAPHVPDPVNAEPGKDELRDIVSHLGDKVAMLEKTVTSLTPPDETPTKRVPWTKRGGRK